MTIMPFFLMALTKTAEVLKIYIKSLKLNPRNMNAENMIKKLEATKD